jgi:hypothetical protein
VGPARDRFAELLEEHGVQQQPGAPSEFSAESLGSAARGAAGLPKGVREPTLPGKRAAYGSLLGAGFGALWDLYGLDQKSQQHGDYWAGEIDRSGARPIPADAGFWSGVQTNSGIDPPQQ